MGVRILLDQNNIKISKPGREVWSGNPDDFILSDDMKTMTGVASGVVYVAPGGREQINFNTPFSETPYCVVSATNSNLGPGPAQYYAEMQMRDGMYRWVWIHNKNPSIGFNVSYVVLRPKD